MKKLTPQEVSDLINQILKDNDCSFEVLNNIKIKKRSEDLKEEEKK